MSETPRLQLPYVQAAQAQKHVTVNRSLDRLDLLVNLAAKSRMHQSPPSDPQDGDRYVVPPGASGAWQGRDNAVAAFAGDAWAYFPPHHGMQVWIEEEARRYTFGGAGWTAETAPSDPLAGAKFRMIREEADFAASGAGTRLQSVIPPWSFVLAAACLILSEVTGVSGWKLHTTETTGRDLIPSGPLAAGARAAEFYSTPLAVRGTQAGLRLSALDGGQILSGRGIISVHLISFSFPSA